MAIIAGIATIDGRQESLAATVASLRHQVDSLYVYCNDYDAAKYPGFPADMYCYTCYEDRGDAAKFSRVAYCDPGDIYLACDDDLIYPPDYVEHIVAGLERHPDSVVSFHGRIMAAGIHFNSYYNDSYGFPCLGSVFRDLRVDCAGSGVMAFHVKHAPDLKWILSQPKNMADIHMARHAKSKGLKLITLAHPADWIKHGDIDLDSTIWAWANKDDAVQTEFMREVMA